MSKQTLSKMVFVFMLFMWTMACKGHDINYQMPTSTPIKQLTSTKEIKTPTATITKIEITPTFSLTTTQIPQLMGQEHSPNGKWIASVYSSRENEQSFISLIIGNIDGSIQWKVAKSPVEDTPPIISESPVPVRWSSDSKTFFFTYQSFQDGCYTYSQGGNKLFSVDVESGVVSTILNEFASEIVFSPDESKIAYGNFGAHGLKIFDTKTAKTFEFEYLHQDLFASLSNLIWSPNNQQIAYTLWSDPCDAETKTTIVVADVVKISQKMINMSEKTPLRTVEWVDVNKILVSDFQGNSWYLNPITSKLTLIKK